MFHAIILCIIFATKIDSNFISFNKYQQTCLTDIIKNLSIKNLIIPIDKDFEFNKIHFKFMKEISSLNIFSQFPNSQNLRKFLRNENTAFKNYWGKPMIFLNLDSFGRNIRRLFNEENEKYLSQYIWITFIKNEFKIQDLEYFYIPYNCQFLVIVMHEQSFKILEIYNMKIYTWGLYQNIFGLWDEINGLIVDKKEFYKRRFNMNGTIMAAVAPYSVSISYKFKSKKLGNFLLLKKINFYSHILALTYIPAYTKKLRKK